MKKQDELYKHAEHGELATPFLLFPLSSTRHLLPLTELLSSSRQATGSRRSALPRTHVTCPEDCVDSDAERQTQTRYDVIGLLINLVEKYILN